MQGSGGSPLKALGEASFPLGAEAGSPTPKPIIVRALGLSITALAFNAWASRTEHFSKCRQRLDDGALQPVTNRGGTAPSQRPLEPPVTGPAGRGPSPRTTILTFVLRRVQLYGVTLALM